MLLIMFFYSSTLNLLIWGSLEDDLLVQGESLAFFEDHTLNELQKTVDLGHDLISVDGARSTDAVLAVFSLEVLEDLRQVSCAAISDRPPVVSWVEFWLGGLISLSGRFLRCRLDWVAVFVEFGSLDLRLGCLSEFLPLLWAKLVRFHLGLK